MPVARYFFFVGGVLLALLFISDAYLPKIPVAKRASTDLRVIRIHSDRKWPERVVFDTSHPTIVPVQTAKTEAGVTAPAKVADDVSAKARVRDAYAELQPSDQRQALLSEPKKPEPKPQRKRKIAKRRAPTTTVLVAQQPQFGLFGNSIW
jgi:hypothetical protein